MLKIGHRGAMGYEPENTIASFKKALELKADMIELDIHNCRSGEIIVIHDFTLERTTDGKGLVSNKSLNELKQLKIEKTHSIPTLKEVFDLISDKVQVNIELKGDGTETSILDFIKKNRINYEQILVSSFDYEKLKEIRKQDNKIKIGLLINEPEKDMWEKAEKVSAWSINFNKRIINRSLVQSAHERNLKVLVWTVNKTEKISYIKSLNVDGIFSNYPDRL